MAVALGMKRKGCLPKHPCNYFKSMWTGEPLLCIALYGKVLPRSALQCSSRPLSLKHMQILHNMGIYVMRIILHVAGYTASLGLCKVLLAL